MSNFITKWFICFQVTNLIGQLLGSNRPPMWMLGLALIQICWDLFPWITLKCITISGSCKGNVGWNCCISSAKLIVFSTIQGHASLLFNYETMAALRWCCFLAISLKKNFKLLKSSPFIIILFVICFDIPEGTHEGSFLVSKFSFPMQASVIHPYFLLLAEPG